MHALLRITYRIYKHGRVAALHTSMLLAYSPTRAANTHTRARVLSLCISIKWPYPILYRLKWLPITHIERNAVAGENEIYEIDQPIGTQKKIAISNGIISGIYMGLHMPQPLPLSPLETAKNVLLPEQILIQDISLDRPLDFG